MKFTLEITFASVAEVDRNSEAFEAFIEMTFRHIAFPDALPSREQTQLLRHTLMTIKQSDLTEENAIRLARWINSEIGSSDDREIIEFELEEAA